MPPNSAVIGTTGYYERWFVAVLPALTGARGTMKG